MQRDDGALRLTVPRAGESNQNACFSPDGSFLIFTRFARGYNRGPAQIMRLDLAPDAEPVALTSGDFDHVNVPYGCFDRTSGRVVFAADRDGANDIWSVAPDADAPDLRRLTNHGELPVWIEPVVSPDGSALALEADIMDTTNEQDARAAIVRVDLASGEATRISNTSGDQDDRLPSWSPDGTQILYQHRDPAQPNSLEHWQAWVMQPDGSGAQNLSAGAVVDQPGPDTDLSWMPDGRFILSSTNPGGVEHPSIYLLPVAGGATIRVTNEPDREDGAASASPDGLRIAFESHRSPDESSPSDLWIIDTPAAALP
ncbi:MAG: hypothetical protein GXP55_10985 [Deltaproteobacteria bacterium]|nr:hypothetical protein [Deltaproteobacteria bacterium]